MQRLAGKHSTRPMFWLLFLGGAVPTAQSPRRVFWDTCLPTSRRKWSRTGNNGQRTRLILSAKYHEGAMVRVVDVAITTPSLLDAVVVTRRRRRVTLLLRSLRGARQRARLPTTGGGGEGGGDGGGGTGGDGKGGGGVGGGSEGGCG